MTILQGEFHFLRPEGMGNKLCLPCWPWGILVHSPVPHQEDSPSGTTTEEMLCEPVVLLQGVCNARGAFLGVYNAASMQDTLVLCRSPLLKQGLYTLGAFFLEGVGRNL